MPKKSITATVIDPPPDARLRKIGAKKERERVQRAVERVARRIKSRAALRKGSDDELLGYNKDGLFD